MKFKILSGKRSLALRESSINRLLKSASKSRGNGNGHKGSVRSQAGKSGKLKKKQSPLAGKSETEILDDLDHGRGFAREIAQQNAGISGENGDRSKIMIDLPRRQRMKVNPDTSIIRTRPSMVDVRVSKLRVILRIFYWMYPIGLFWFGTFFDIVTRRDSVMRRAVRLRTTLETVGGTFIKLGQQMSLRLDILPFEYCDELAKMLNRVPAFPTEQAIKLIEMRTNQKIEDVFAAFDPDPIGSASLACVFHAVLKNGERVAVKVRRPKIVQKFASDLGAIDWMMKLSEFLTLVRPGVTSTIRKELKAMLFEELDFRMEARYQDLFRVRAKKHKLKNVSAPRIHYHLCSEDVLVSEFVTGIWVTEVLAAVENKDQDALAYLKSLDIDPKVMASRIMRAGFFGQTDNLFFHADPHPANMVCQPGNKLFMVDFGSCGTRTSRDRRLTRALQYHYAHEDVGSMVNVAIAMLEPLPPIDVHDMAKQFETQWWQVIYRMKSKHSEWWERSSALMWLQFMTISSQYNAPLDVSVLRFIRSTMLYDTVSARLYNKLDIFKEYRKYAKTSNKISRRRVQKGMKMGGTSKKDQRYASYEKMVDMGARLMQRIDMILDKPPLNFGYMVGKAVFAASAIMRLAWLYIVTIAVYSVGVGLWHHYYLGQDLPVGDMIYMVVMHPFYQIIALFFTIVNIRRVLFRFNDRDV